MITFDLDGTLINTEELIKTAHGEQGYMLSPEDKDQFSFKFIEGYGPPPDFQWDLFFYRLFTERFDELSPVDSHVQEFIEFLYLRGDKKPIRIITARPYGVLMYHAIIRL
jgi:FMN phosphatase YigB (HAD superfamily)